MPNGKASLILTKQSILRDTARASIVAVIATLVERTDSIMFVCLVSRFGTLFDRVERVNL